MQLTAARLAEAQKSTLGDLTVCQVDGNSERGNHMLFRQVLGEVCCHSGQTHSYRSPDGRLINKEQRSILGFHLILSQMHVGVIYGSITFTIFVPSGTGFCGKPDSDSEEEQSN